MGALKRKDLGDSSKFSKEASTVTWSKGVNSSKPKKAKTSAENPSISSQTKGPTVPKPPKVSRGRDTLWIPERAVKHNIFGPLLRNSGGLTEVPSQRIVTTDSNSLGMILQRMGTRALVPVFVRVTESVMTVPM
jgi:hypothetical protein